MNLPSALEDLIDSFKLLPGVGSRSAERYANYIIKRSPDIAQRLAENLNDIHQKIKYCPITFALISSDQNYSELYTDPKRNKQIVAIVSEPFDIYAIENTNQYKGTYHVLGGLISPLDNISPEQLHIKELLKRIKQDEVKEVILATNVSVEGESTALYIQSQIKASGVKLTRLAQGLPMGVDLEYADPMTLSKALEGRRSI
jgi:recombination protein RecR